MYYLGIDTGGTFTDFVLYDRATGRLETFKLRSEPRDPGAPVAQGLARLKAEYGVSADRIERLIYGTTVATNAVLELKGARTALVTTRGIRDVLEIQRQWRNRLFDLYLEKPRPLVRRRWRLEVEERVDAAGQVLVPLSPAEIERCVAAVAALPVEAVAIVLLFSFLRPEHEERLASAIKARLPHLDVTVSSAVSPEFREYERSATTAMNAYTMPKIDALARRLDDVLAEAGFKGSFGIIQSNGGVMSSAKARSHPVHTLLSGPAGGVVGATALARAAGLKDILTMDIGGTSTDIALVEGAEIRLTPEGGIGGYPVRVPQVSVHTIGAGGGSIARPELGMLKVGPQSAGADPGPACYGQGGTEPTSTDAALALGFIDPDYFLGGEMALDKRAAERAILVKVATPFGMAPEEAALAIMRVQVSNIIAGIRKVSVEAGRDPRDFALLPFGGAGGLYAGLIAEEMGLRRIFLPQHPSVLSALGMLMTDIRHTRSATRLVELARAEPPVLEQALAALGDEVTRDLAVDHIAAADIAYEFSADLRYVGQAYEINLRLPATGRTPQLDLAALGRAFHEEHRRLYGHAAENEPVELVTLRVQGEGRVEQAALTALPEGPRGLPQPKGWRRLLFDRAQGWVECPVYERRSLPRGATLTGPAVIEDRGSSLPILPGHRLEVDAYGNLLIAVPARARREVVPSGTGRIDPVTLEVVGNHLVSTVREMGATLMRTAYSVILREQMDCTTALFDPTGQLIAQADHVPSHQGTLSYGAKYVARHFRFDPGDVVIMNHPYRGGTHHPDIMIFKPVFHEGRQVALAAALGHQIDVGGRSPGSVATDARDVFEEGLIIPPLKLYKRGEVVEEVLAMIEANIRVPKKTLGDIRAEVAAVTVGERRFVELVERHGAERLAEIVAALLDHSETMMRRDLADYPDGTYRALGHMDGDGVDDRPVDIAVAVTLARGAVTLDFTGSSPQLRGPFNCSISSVQAACFCAVRYMVNPKILQNEGCYRPIALVLPPRSVVSPEVPAPLSGRFHTLERIATTIVAAFNAARGSEAVGSNHGHLTSFSTSGRVPGTGEPFVLFEYHGGGWGGTSRCDGLDATFGLMANSFDNPIEAIELEYPLRIERYELIPESGGAGRFRGGLGLRKEIRYLHGEGYFTNRSDAQRYPAEGVLGGAPGRPSRHALIQDGMRRDLPSKITNLVIAAGDLMVLETAGGGGYGSSLERDPARVLDDVEDGKVAPATAEQVYGVVLREGSSVDAAATAALRRRLSSGLP